VVVDTVTSGQKSCVVGWVAAEGVMRQMVDAPVVRGCRCQRKKKASGVR
jgi:hypothetical protein